MDKLAGEAFVAEYIKEIQSKDPGIGGEKLWMMYRKKFGREESVVYNRFYDICHLVILVDYYLSYS